MMPLYSHRAPRARRPSLGVLAAAWLAALLLAFGALAAHAAPPTPQETEAQLAAARKQIDDIRKHIPDEADDADMVEQRGNALDIQSKADAAAEALAPQLAAVTARLSELGPAPENGKEAPDVAAQRAQLEKTSRALDAQIKLARLLSVDAAQTAEQISAQRRKLFQARLGERRDSFLAGQFWQEFHEEFPRDLERLDSVGEDLANAARQTPAWAWLLVGGLIALTLAVRVGIGRLLLHLTATRVPPGRLRRSFLAMAQVALSTATPGLIALLLYVALDWNSQWNDTASITLTANMIAIAAFGGYAAGLGNALMSPRRPSWRLPPIGDEVARRLRWVPNAVGVLVALTWLAERLPVLLNASLTTTITVTGIVAVLIMLTLAAALNAGRRLRLKAQREDGESAVPFWVSALNVAIWTVLVISLCSLLAGYVAFGSFLTKQVLWVLMVLGTAYLLSVLIEDGFSTLLGSGQSSESEGPSLRDQAAVLLSGLGRVAVGLLALMLLVAPFGEGPMDLLQRFDQLRKGLAIGEAQIRPGALLQALLVLAVSLLSVKMLKRWLRTRYLPTTELDPGMQLSAATLFGYAGFVLAVALALSAAGIGLERVAWIASALSVGIGFGLQAVVQNFVSGLILLAERPVKVGDWVSLGGVEGDILRINVRATEIQMGDRSTVIVPNSEFVTKTVRNVTRSNPLGLVQLRLPMPLATDAEQVRERVLDVFKTHEDVLESPAPNVYLEGIESGHLIFSAKGYVSSPRATYGVRSALLFSVLKRLRDDGLEMAAPPTMLLAQPPQPPAAPPAEAPGKPPSPAP